ncbi:HEAT repeat domain-containing protein [Schlesneria sp. T3-172]|uniref:HEAT repeat domain-containing protein n=1 Tax=Schlesneria sphaerica TaxID=3373610 RepID=UPI0037C9DE55
MSKCSLRTIVAVTACVGFFAGIAGPFHSSIAIAQQTQPKTEPSTNPEEFRALVERISKLESEVERLKKGTPVAAGTDAQVLAMLDVAHLGLFYSGNGQTRFLALHVLLANTTRNSYTIARDQIIAEIDGEERKLVDLPQQLQNYTVQSGKQHFQISAMKPQKEWKLPSGGQTGIWLVYADLPLGPNVPKCLIKVKLGDDTKEINVNELQRAQLSLEVERIGPRESLALMTIGGAINSFNAGTFVDELDKLVAQKVARVVVRWIDGASPPDPQLMNWLQSAAAGNAGNPNANQMFPMIPSAIREFHLTEFPVSDEIASRGGSGYGLRSTGQVRLHKSSAEAVGAALRTAYLALPRDELLNEIRTGNPLSRAAALAYGGGRLSVENLPQIFEWAEDKDPELQKAALQALSHFGEPEAIEKLVLYAKRNVDPLSISAIESLAGSRFGAAHDALLVLLKNEPAESRKKIVQVLAKYPRPIWSDALYEFVTNAPANMDVESLKALVQVGHPQLVEVLERALRSPDKQIRDLAFQTLSQRNDQRSETLAIDYALKVLDQGPPDSNVVQLLSRTRDVRAVPLLLKQLDSGNDRVTTINLLLQLGDQDVADKLVAKYPSLNNNEKVQVLQGLKLFRHSKFRDLCGEALLSNDNQLVSTAATALTLDGHPDGEKLLISAVEKQRMNHLLGNIMNALANFGTPTARAALIKARDSGETNKRNYANSALLTLRQRSPGFQYSAQGDMFSKNQQEKEAMEAYDLALQLDSELPEAYLGRGQLLLKKEKFAEACKDFEKVIELKHEPLFPGEFVTSLAIARIGDGRVEEGLTYLEEHRPSEEVRDPNRKALRALFLYNAACAYSRAFEQAEKRTDLPDRDTLREKYRTQAVKDLRESIKNGFDDFAWMAKDPDFKPIHEDPEFKKILAEKPQDKTEKKEAE